MTAWIVAAAVALGLVLIVLADPWTYRLRIRATDHVRDELDKHAEDISEGLRALREAQDPRGF